MRATVAILTALTLIPGSAIAGYQSLGPAILPRGWNAPSGWHVDRLVKRAVADGGLTGTGLPARAVLLTNDVSISLVVFIDYRSPSFKVYTVFVEPAADFKSDAGIKIDSPKPIEIEPAPDLCGSKWLRCDKRKYFFDPPMPSLWLQMGDWGGSVFRWKNLSQGFDRLSVGDSATVTNRKRTFLICPAKLIGAKVLIWPPNAGSAGFDGFGSASV